MCKLFKIDGEKKNEKPINISQASGYVIIEPTQGNLC